MLTVFPMRYSSSWVNNYGLGIDLFNGDPFGCALSYSAHDPRQQGLHYHGPLTDNELSLLPFP